ncbi:FliH/SctL family protein [Turicibacter sanguinis]|uniref:hypothetical protein n=1 Tax=Turicibacter sanguinis TaxID=154288 RepID=UPI0021D48DD3|nr:hypothetical protein [Turicibacter sanguinis]MCU7192231.1 hypothetical protein [Turicibacter sanguinis]
MSRKKKQMDLNPLILDYFLIDRIKEVLNQEVDDHAKANLLCDIVKDEVERITTDEVEQRCDESYDEGYEDGYDDGQEGFNEEDYREGCDDGFGEGVVAGITRVLNETDLNLTSEQTGGIEYLLFKAKRER